MAPAPNLRGGGGKSKTTKLQKAAEIHFLLVSFPAPCDLSWSQGVRKQLTGLLVFGTMYNEMANIWPDEPTLFLAQNTADVWFSSIHSLIQSAYKYWNRLTSVCCQLMLKPRMAPSRPSPGLFPSNFRMRPRICRAAHQSWQWPRCGLWRSGGSCSLRSAR